MIVLPSGVWLGPKSGLNAIDAKNKAALGGLKQWGVVSDA